MKVKKEMLLMDYLLLSFNRKNAKNLLKYKQVYVNNQQISQFDYLLHENDQVEIKKENTSSFCSTTFFLYLVNASTFFLYSVFAGIF